MEEGTEQRLEWGGLKIISLSNSFYFLKQVGGGDHHGKHMCYFGIFVRIEEDASNFNEQAKRVLTHTSLDWATCGNGLKPG